MKNTYILNETGLNFNLISDRFFSPTAGVTYLKHILKWAVLMFTSLTNGKTESETYQYDDSSRTNESIEQPPFQRQPTTENERRREIK